MTFKPETEFAFYFNFYDEDADSETTFGFLVKDPATLYATLGVADFDEMTEPLGEHAANVLEPRYGVHDWSSSPNPAVNAVGYTTYEVPNTKMIPLMDEWRDWFTTHGGAPTAVVAVSTSATLGDDLGIFTDIKTTLDRSAGRSR